MNKPDYLSKILQVAQSRSSPENPIEDRIWAVWTSYELAASSNAYDAFATSSPMRSNCSRLIELLYQTDTGTPEIDVAQLLEKDKAYGGSWHSRGGVGAFFAMARKADRFREQIIRPCTSIAKARLVPDQSEHIVDTIADWRRYLILFEAWHVALAPTLTSLEQIGDQILSDRAAELKNPSRHSSKCLMTPGTGCICGVGK